MLATTQTMIATVLALALLGTPAPAGEEQLEATGAWELVSIYTEETDTKMQSNVYGEHPRGYMTMTAAGRFYAYVASDWPKPVESVWEDVAQSLPEQTAGRHAIHYSGTYRLEGGKFVTRIDQVQHEGWIGTDPFDITWTEGLAPSEEVRTFFLTGGSELARETLHIETAPMPNPNGYGNAIIAKIIWARPSK